jgi:penicillin-binding protein 1C
MRYLLSVIVFINLSSPAFCMPSFTETRAGHQSSDALLLDRHGNVIHELRVDPHGRRLDWAKLADISPALVQAVIRSEDKRFHDHRGVDWKALAAAAAGYVFSTGKRGASTITMQLASLVDPRPLRGKSRRSLARKWMQIRAARELENTWSKQELLEAYLNLVSFRGELQGISAASRGIFDKAPSGLDEAESAILAALIRSPNAVPARVGERAALLAATLGSAVPSDRIRQLALDRLSITYSVRKQITLAPHVARRLLGNGATSAASTLDARLQKFSIEALKQAVVFLSNQNVRDGAALVADNRTGDVLAYVGNAGHASSTRYVDGIRARRQAGSTLKPFLYGLAVENRIITAASLIDDAPLDLPTGRGVYRPENYDREFRGAVTARIALASSLNIPAVKTLNLVRTEAFVQTLRAFGFTELSEPEHYGPSLALGSADISLWELVNAYRAMANGGTWSQLRLSQNEKKTPRKRVLSAGAAFIVSDILADREARSATFSLESPLATRYWTAVKTGTSKDMRDNWCVGYSDRYTVGVWVGNFTGEPMWNVSGVSGAAPVWHTIMNYLHQATLSRPPSVPPGVTARFVTFFESGNAALKPEWFINGTEQEIVRISLAEIQPKIVYPAPDTMIAIDPDIPAELQKIFFESSVAATWVLDGKQLDTSSAVSWSPVPGIHKLSLISNDSAVLDHIVFEVR